MTIDAMLRALRRRSGSPHVRIVAGARNVRVRWTHKPPVRFEFDFRQVEAPTLREALRHALAWYAAQEQEQEQPAEAGEEVAHV